MTRATSVIRLAHALCDAPLEEQRAAAQAFEEARAQAMGERRRYVASVGKFGPAFRIVKGGAL